MLLGVSRKRVRDKACVLAFSLAMSEIRILCIDDNPADIRILRYALDDQGEEYEIQVLKDGEEALLFVREHREGKHEPKPCVIVLDVHLPKHNGVAVLRAINQAPTLRHIRVLTTSGQAHPAEMDEIGALGAVYRQKPYSLDEYAEFAAEIIALCKQTLSATA
jgi:chemotaxis family two-component system response regulator Rcp1